MAPSANHAAHRPNGQKTNGSKANGPSKTNGSEQKVNTAAQKVNGSAQKVDVSDPKPASPAQKTETSPQKAQKVDVPDHKAEPPPKTDSPADPPRPHQDHESENVFDDFVTFINRLCSEKSYQGLKAMSLDYDRLRQELDATKTAYSKNIEEMTRIRVDASAERTRLETQLQEQTKEYSKGLEDKVKAFRKLRIEQDKVDGLADKIESLEREVERMIIDGKKHEARIFELDGTIAGQTEQLEAAKKEAEALRGQLQSTSDQLGTQSKALAHAESKIVLMRSFTAELTPLEQERAGISEMLGSSFADASDLFTFFLEQDLDADRLKDSRSWDRVRDHASIQRAIPLPASNSAHAKHMRIMAGLVIYARALAQYVFRATYLSEDNGVDAALGALPASNPVQDAFVRTVLLKVLPDQQRACRDASAERVVEEVSAALSGWLPADQLATFRARLGNLTSVLCGSWQRVQRLDERVEPIFTFNIPEDWQPLPSAGVAASDDGESAPGSPRPLQGQGQEHALSAGDVVKVVWPAFLATSLEQPAGEEEEGPSDLIRQGYVLTRADVRGAANEEMPRRAMRRATREGDAAVQAQRKRRDSAVFLSHAASDGSDAR